MTKKLTSLLASVAIAGLSITGLAAGAASAGTYYADPELTAAINLNGNVVNNHEYDMTYTCGVDGTITYAGVGSASDVTTETISGTLDTVNRTFTYTSAYNNGAGYSYTTSGTLSGTATSGTIPYSGTGSDGSLTFGVSGDYLNVPNCAPAPVTGNHGQYVSGAAKAGVKGAALAAIAKDGTKVGPYPG